VSDYNAMDLAERGQPLPPAATPPDLSIVIPAFNEQRRLPATLATICGYLRAQQLRWELIIVDDGSTDDTSSLVETLAYADDRVRLIKAQHRGKGHAVGLGVLGSRGHQILLCDADLPTPIEDVALLQRAVRCGASVAIGSRARLDGTQPGDVRPHPARAMLGRAANALIRAIAIPDIRDTQCGFKLYEGDRARAAFRRARIDGWAFDIEVLRIFSRRGWPIREVPVRWVHQKGSKVRPIDYLWTFRDLVRIRLADR